jgi:hypothetical protein
VVFGGGDPLRDALAIMSAWADDADEQSFLHRHVRDLIADLKGDRREDALIDLITGLIILNGGLLRLQAEQTGVTIASILTSLRQRTATDEP